MQEHEEWLRIAKEDLMAAKGLLKLELFSTVTYHCQQSAEKMLKGYLAFKKQEILKSHDLVKLVGLCKKFDLEFDEMYDFVDNLNPYATKFRYPSEYNIPDVEDAKIAIKHAASIMRFVLKKIAEPTTGQTDIFGDPNK